MDGGLFVSMQRTNVANKFSEIVKTAAIARYTIHDLRRTFCTDLMTLDVNQPVVRELAEHQEAATTAKYYQWADDPMKREAINRLNRGAG